MRLFILLGLLCLPLVAIAETTSTSSSNVQYPREFGSPQGKVVTHAPQIDSWTGYEEVTGKSAVEVTLTGMDKPSLGTIRYTAKTVTNLEDHTVNFYDISIAEVKFLQADAKQSAEMTALVEATLKRRQLTIPLTLLLQYLDDAIIPDGGVNLSMAPPVIFYSMVDSRLLSLDGEPMLVPTTNDKDLKFVVNTNWDLFYLESEKTWYLLDGERWYSMSSEKLTGDWQAADSLPDAFDNLPASKNWSSVRKAMPAKADNSPLPKIFISDKPAELIMVDGKPKLEAIAETGISYVTNTKSDLFLYDGTYYFLVSGRWFSTGKMGGKWSSVTQLPESFANIPPDHPRGSVLVAVPGTDEAKIAVLEAVIPRKAEINRNYVPPVTVKYVNDEPQFKRIESTDLYLAVNTDQIVLQTNDQYFLCYNAAWFLSDQPAGPWRVADKVPSEIYDMPVESSAYNCTHVYVYNSSPEYVTTGYDSGYFSVYTYYGVPWYGTGWYYYPYYRYPYYWRYPPTYGSSAWYNPNNGNYGVGQSITGPYGGAGRVAVYNPETGAYARGRAVWTDDAIAKQGIAYNPSTGTGVYTNRYADEDGAWGQSLVKRDDKWIATQSERQGNQGSLDFRTSGGASGSINREVNDGVMTGDGQITRGDKTVDTKMVRTEDGVARTFTDADGNKSGYVKNSEGDLYAGKDGEVYKREDGEWSKHGEDGWEPVEREPGDRSGNRETAERTATTARDFDLKQSDLDAVNPSGGLDRDLNRDLDRSEGLRGDRQPAATTYRQMGPAASNSMGTSRETYSSRPNRQPDRSYQAGGRASQLDREHSARSQGFNRHSSRGASMARGRAGGGRMGGGRRR